MSDRLERFTARARRTLALAGSTRRPRRGSATRGQAPISLFYRPPSLAGRRALGRGHAHRQLYGIQGIPEALFVNATGELRGVFVGPANEAELHRRIDALLEG